MTFLSYRVLIIMSSMATMMMISALQQASLKQIIMTKPP